MKPGLGPAWWPVSPWGSSARRTRKHSVGRADCTAWLRKWLDRAVSEKVISAVATPLSAAGCSLDTRRLLGNHVARSDAAWMAYSVEGLAGPLREMGLVLQRVSAGRLVDLKSGHLLDSRGGGGREPSRNKMLLVGRPPRNQALPPQRARIGIQKTNPKAAVQRLGLFCRPSPLRTHGRPKRLILRSCNSTNTPATAPSI